MAVIFLNVCNSLPDSLANVELISDEGEFTNLYHTLCKKSFLYKNSKETTECPHCKGDIVFPRADW